MERRPDSVGRPLPNVEVRISEEGEIWARGDNISPGYWNAPEQTAATFQDGWYKTGDLGYFDDEGFLHIRGRMKDMIVLPSGQNVYPDDIQAVLNRHPNVTDSAVVGLTRGSSVEVHAALILNDPEDAETIVAWANAQLAEQQRVRGFTVWPDEDFPRTHTLKVRKPLLIERLQGNMAPAEVAPSGPAASRGQQGARNLINIVAEVAMLDTSEVEPDMTLGDDLNLDSLGRVELLSAIEADLGVYLDESQIDPETTLRQLGQILEEGANNPPVTKFPDWGMDWWCRMTRGFIQRLLVFPIMWLPYGLKVTGREKLEGIQGPALFASNHSLGLDNPLIIKAIPPSLRRRLAIAGAATLWRNPVFWVLNPLLGNGFPIAHRPAWSKERSGPAWRTWAMFYAHTGQRLVGADLP